MILKPPARYVPMKEPRNIQIAFAIRDKVRVIELDRPGVVISIHIGVDGIRYEVRYFWDGVAKEVYFFDWEIEHAA